MWQLKLLLCGSGGGGLTFLFYLQHNYFINRTQASVINRCKSRYGLYSSTSMTTATTIMTGNNDNNDDDKLTAISS